MKKTKKRRHGAGDVDHTELAAGCIAAVGDDEAHTAADTAVAHTVEADNVEAGNNTVAHASVVRVASVHAAFAGVVAVAGASAAAEHNHSPKDSYRHQQARTPVGYPIPVVVAEVLEQHQH